MKTYWWQRFYASAVHVGYRVVVDYEICNDQKRDVQYYTGRSKMDYVPA
ncbi:hypothetical protein KJ866_00500 [Patescibacteria group bacterium]|nr:hypothetical protein [Patescibacteria group bacterium]